MPRTIHISNNEDVRSEIMVVIAAIAISIGLALPLWGLAVILFDFTLVFLPVFVVAAIVIGVIKAVHLIRKRAGVRVIP